MEKSFLRESIQSVISQKYKNWELIFGIINLQIDLLKFLRVLKIRE